MSENYFCPGGTLPNHILSYVERKADNALFQALQSGDFCYVLDTRQVGKSSLMVRTAQRLNAIGHHTAILDISSLGENLTQEQWYFGLLINLGISCGLETEAEEYWVHHNDLGNVQRWFMAIHDVFLSRLQRPLIVFIDEIDSIRKLSFSIDEFFAAIRACHNRRASDGAAPRLTFCLIGVATPSDLIQDVRTTPFNVGRRIELHDFTLTEMMVLSAGLPGNILQRREQIARIRYWTCGHPYLTQKLCQAIAKTERPCGCRELDELCRRIFLCHDAQDAEDNLKFVSRHLLADDMSRADILTLYQRILTHSLRSTEAMPDALVQRLLLSGLLCMAPEQDRRLVIRNRIYATVFDRRWIQANMPGAEVRRQRAALRRGFARASLLWAFFGALITLSLYQTKRAASESGRAQEALNQKRRLTQEVGRLKTDIQSTHSDLSLAGDNLKVTRAALKSARDTETKLTRSNLIAAEKLRSKETILQREDADLIAQKQNLKALGREKERVINDIEAMIAPLTMAGHGSELQTIRFGLNNVLPTLQQGRRPSRQAMQVLVDAVSAGVVRQLRVVHPDGVVDAALSPEGTRLVTAGAGRYAYVWEITTGKLLQRLDAMPDPTTRRVINNVIYSRDGRWIVTAGDDHRVCIWNAHALGSLQAEPLCVLTLGRARLTSASLSYERSRLITLSGDAQVQVWELKAPPHSLVPACTLLRTFNILPQDRNQYLWAVDISRDGRRAAAVGSDKQLRVWDVDSGKYLLHVDHAHDQIVNSVRFNAWGNHIITAGSDRTVRLWSLDAGAQMNDYRGHMDTIYDAEVGANDYYVATAGKEHMVRIFPFNPTVAPLYTLRTHHDRIWNVHFSADAYHLVTASADHTAELWQFTLPTFSTGTGLYSGISFSPMGRYVACCRGDGFATVWDWLGGEHTWHFYSGKDRDDKAACQYAGFSHNGQELVTAGSSGQVKVWRLKDYAKYRIYTGASLVLQNFSRTRWNTVVYSPDDRTILGAGADGTAVLWDSRTGIRRCVFPVSSGEVTSAFFSPDGRHIVTTSRRDGLTLWDVGSIQTRRTLSPPDPDHQKPDESHGPVSAVFSPDGRYILSADRDHRAHLWEMQTGRYIGSLDGHGASLTAVAFSPDGRSIATSSEDRTVCLWDSFEAFSHKKATPLYTLRSHSAEVRWLDFSPDGHWLATSSWDGTCRVYPATFTDIVAKAQQLARMPLVEPHVPNTAAHY